MRREFLRKNVPPAPFQTMRSRVNGLCTSDYVLYRPRETALANVAADPKFVPARYNGVSPEDGLFDANLVLYLPLYALSGAKFTSQEGQNHACTRTGAVWNPQGLSFGGTDDNVNAGSATILDNLTGNQTHMVWINPTSLGENNLGRILIKGTFQLFMAATATVVAQIVVATVAKGATAPNNSTPFGSWSCVFLSFNSVNISVDVGGTTTTGQATAGPIDSHATADYLIGDIAASNRCYNGLIGELWSWNRALSQAERDYMRAVTAWRYQ